MIRSLFQQRMDSWKKNWALQFSTLVVVTACYGLICMSLVFSQNLKKILTVWGEDLQMTVYLSENTNPRETLSLQERLKSKKEIGKVRFISKEEALNDFRGQMASYAPEILNENDTLSLIPASLQISLSETIAAIDHVKVLEGIAKDLRNESSVSEVSYGQDWVQKYGHFVHYFERISQAIGVIILCAALFVLSNVIRASVQARKQEIEVLELIGATPGMIRRPFLMEGALIGALASGLALTLCFSLYSSLVGMFEKELKFLQLAQHFHFISFGIIVSFVVIGTFMGALGSYLCVRQINDGWAARSR